jgi:heme exporter protein A
LFNISLTAENLSASRGGFVLFDNVSFILNQCDGLCLTGPNGSGKTTLLRCIANLVRPDCGLVHFEHSSENTLRRVHYFSHRDAMKDDLTVRENLTFWAKFQSGDSESNTEIQVRIMESLWELGLDRLADLPVSVLSSGQRRRASFARMLITRSEVWLLDEPDAGLDADAKKTLRQQIESYRVTGGIVIIATHQANNEVVTDQWMSDTGLPAWQTLSLQNASSRVDEWVRKNNSDSHS